MWSIYFSPEASSATLPPLFSCWIIICSSVYQMFPWCRIRGKMVIWCNKRKRVMRRRLVHWHWALVLLYLKELRNFRRSRRSEVRWLKCVAHYELYDAFQGFRRSSSITYFFLQYSPTNVAPLSEEYDEMMKRIRSNEITSSWTFYALRKRFVE